MVGVVQGLGVAGVLSLGAVWAISMDRAPIEEYGVPTPSAQCPAAVAPSDVSSSMPSSWTFYIVGSESQAQMLRDGISDGNSIRHELGLAPLSEEVLVVNTSAEAQLLAERLYEGNRILASFGVEDRVVNLVQ